jgi:mannose-1-phosphate guanylyltransferase
MHAVILAGGAGTRLRPLTLARRKELVPVLGKPLLAYRIENLREHGVTDIVIATGQGTREIEGHFGDGSSLGVHLTYVYEERRLGSGRAVKEAARSAGATGTIAVCNGDILTNVNLTSMLAKHRETGAAMSMSLFPVHEPWHFGVASIDDGWRISGFVEKPAKGTQPSNLINAGTWLWEPTVLDRIPDDESAVVDGFAERVLFPGLIAAGLHVQGFEEDMWLDVGSPAAYLAANVMLLEREARRLHVEVIVADGAHISDDADFSGVVYVGPGAAVEEGAYVIGPSVIGAGTAIAENTKVEGSVLWENVRVSRRATVAHSIIGAGASVGAGAQVRSAVIANDARVMQGQRPDAGLRLGPGEVCGP